MLNLLLLIKLNRSTNPERRKDPSSNFFSFDLQSVNHRSHQNNLQIVQLPAPPHTHPHPTLHHLKIRQLLLLLYPQLLHTLQHIPIVGRSTTFQLIRTLRISFQSLPPSRLISLPLPNHRNRLVSLSLAHLIGRLRFD